SGAVMLHGCEVPTAEPPAPAPPGDAVVSARAADPAGAVVASALGADPAGAVVASALEADPVGAVVASAVDADPAGGPINSNRFNRPCGLSHALTSPPVSITFPISTARLVTSTWV